MTARRPGSWAVVLAAMGLLTIACAVGYVVAPSSDSSPVDSSIPKEHRIVTIDDDGRLVVLDRRHPTGDRVTLGGVGEVGSLAVDHEGTEAYTAPDDPTGAVRVVDLATGHHREIGRGTDITVDRIAFPHLPAGTARPDVSHAAYATQRDDRPRIVIQNLTTGATRDLDPFGESAPFESVDDLAWDPFDNTLYGIADGGSTLFRIDTDRAGSLDDAVLSAPLADGHAWTAITAYRDGVAAVLRRADGTEIVQVDARTMEVGRRLARLDGASTIDADPAARDLLITTQARELYRLSTDTPAAPELVTTGVRLAVW